MNFKNILFSIEDSGVALLCLNRPAQLNSFNEAMHLELQQALGEVRSNPAIRALLLTGEGRGFCAGQDLFDGSVLGTGEPLDLGRVIERFYNPLISALRELPKAVVCAVNGVAAGAGANFALACDVVVAARSAYFVQAFGKIGLVPDAGGTFFLPRLIGSARAKALMLLGDKLSAEQAEDWGMIWRVVDDELLREEALMFARKLAKAPYSLALTKQALHTSEHNGFSEQLALERDLQRKAGQSEDFQEGIRAFVQKREPKFNGR